MTKFHAFLICMDAQDVVVMIFVAKLVISPTYRGPEISCMFIPRYHKKISNVL
jgi:hypothetical protein